MPLLELTFDLAPLAGVEEAAAVESACFEAGALSVTLTDAADDPVLEPLPGEVRLWPRTRVEALFPRDTVPLVTARAIAAALALPPERILAREIEDRAWEREWLAHFHAMRFGRRLWVAPHHERVAEPGAVVVRLDPGLAFGTGTHPTTALCLEWLDERLEPGPGTRVIDYGCGSGILGLAAAKLGAARVECFDIDPQALIATEANAAANGVADRVSAVGRDGELTASADVLLSNILAEPLVRLAPRFADLTRAGGALVLAGLLASQADEVTEAYRAWFDMSCFGARDDWVGLTGVRRSRGP
ncbi:MAG TPA: 50S ribosomal protein L11 methyltransferase [Steroidobacteraceae bacterium]|nr:50S ribosomal protein L11 methyltransferase [Steroidobacteraceae bacterium]